jgi:hypothetical protein
MKKSAVSRSDVLPILLADSRLHPLYWGWLDLW